MTPLRSVCCTFYYNVGRRAAQGLFDGLYATVLPGALRPVVDALLLQKQVIGRARRL